MGVCDNAVMVVVDVVAVECIPVLDFGADVDVAQSVHGTSSLPSPVWCKLHCFETLV